MAARYGAEEVKSAETRARQGKISLDVPLSAPTGSKLGLSGGRSRQVQVERQTTTQSMFKEFLDRERSHNGLV